MAGAKKINKGKPRVLTYELLADMTGNPATAQEFDDSPHDEKEVFFTANDDATEVWTCILFFSFSSISSIESDLRS